MTGRLLNLGRAWHARLRDFFDAPLASGATPLEVREAALADVERHVEPVGRRRRIFPYDGLRVNIRAAEAEVPTFRAAFHDFDARVRERLMELRCDLPRALTVTMVPVAAPGAAGDERRFFIEYVPAAFSRGGADPAAAVRIRIHVVKGATADRDCEFVNQTVLIGRTPETVDDLGRIRRNHVAFLDVADGITETVGRAHARLEHDPQDGYRVMDEGSSNGTSIVRRGATIAVPRRDPRGVRLESGDQILLGRAVLQVLVTRETAADSTHVPAPASAPSGAAG